MKNDDGFIAQIWVVFINENGYRNAYLPLYNRAFDEKLARKFHKEIRGVSTYPDLVGNRLERLEDQETNNITEFKIKT